MMQNDTKKFLSAFIPLSPPPAQDPGQVRNCVLLWGGVFSLPHLDLFQSLFCMCNIDIFMTLTF